MTQIGHTQAYLDSMGEFLTEYARELYKDPGFPSLTVQQNIATRTYDIMMPNRRGYTVRAGWFDHILAGQGDPTYLLDQIRERHRSDAYESRTLDPAPQFRIDVNAPEDRVYMMPNQRQHYRQLGYEGLGPWTQDNAGPISHNGGEPVRSTEDEYRERHLEERRRRESIREQAMLESAQRLLTTLNQRESDRLAQKIADEQSREVKDIVPRRRRVMVS